MNEGKYVAIVHSNPSCQPCKATKRHLATLGADYTDTPIIPMTAEMFKRSGLLRAPVVEVYIQDEYGLSFEETWSGHKPDMIDKYFKKGEEDE